MVCRNAADLLGQPVKSNDIRVFRKSGIAVESRLMSSGILHAAGGSEAVYGTFYEVVRKNPCFCAVSGYPYPIRIVYASALAPPMRRGQWFLCTACSWERWCVRAGRAVTYGRRLLGVVENPVIPSFFFGSRGS
jgi:hypothetical protein